MKILEEFKKFALKGSVVDMAVGVVIGGAFGKIVSSLVSNIVMPPLGLLIGGTHFAELKIVLRAADAQGHAEVAMGLGSFLDATLDFLIIAAALFAVIKVINRFKSEPEPTPAAPPEDIQLLRQIRDLLSKKLT